MNQAIYVSATPGPFELERCGGRMVEQVIRPTGLLDPLIEVRPALTQVDDLLEEIRKRQEVGEAVLVTTLTKRMAEDLTEYYEGLDIKVRYLHSDIKTLERMELIRDLRLGEFQVLVGINLLREGLDMPEVSLVAILDADKEGFLRSERALTQTCGRAARNVGGMVIMYGDKVTGSMQRTIDETNRRRSLQDAYNIQHGIIPRTVQSTIKGIGLEEDSGAEELLKAAEKEVGYLNLNDLQKEMKRLEQEMSDCATRLEFEEAAVFRDKIKVLKEKELQWL